MTMTYDTQQPVGYRSRSSRHYGNAAEPIRRLADMVRRHFARKRAVVHLSEFSDHMLRDIGITRHEIERAVYGRMVGSKTHQIHP